MPSCAFASSGKRQDPFWLPRTSTRIFICVDFVLSVYNNSLQLERTYFTVVQRACHGAARVPSSSQGSHGAMNSLHGSLSVPGFLARQISLLFASRQCGIAALKVPAAAPARWQFATPLHPPLLRAICGISKPQSASKCFPYLFSLLDSNTRNNSAGTKRSFGGRTTPTPIGERTHTHVKAPNPPAWQRRGRKPGTARPRVTRARQGRHPEGTKAPARRRSPR